jgi:hypothetical protein
MTDEDIKRGLALCEAAMPGPWFKDQKTVWAPTEDCSQNRFWATVSASPAACSPAEKEATAEFIAQARALLPEARAELERLRRVERAARGMMEVMDEGHRGPLMFKYVDALRTALEES